MPTEVSPQIEVTEPPVGSVISWYSPGIHGLEAIYKALPKNWVLCDGSTLDGSHYLDLKQGDVDPAFFRKHVPNLTNLFVRGADPATPLPNSPQGSDAFRASPFHTEAAGEHDHSLKGETGLISTTKVTQEEGNTDYETWDDNKHADPSAHLRVDVDKNMFEGQHKHVLTGKTERDGNHDHSVALPTIPTVPRHLSLWFIMRIK